MINKKRLITASALLIGAAGWGSYKYYDSNRVVVDPQPQSELVSESVAQQISTFEQQERPRIVSATLLDIISTPEGRESRRNLLKNEVRQIVEVFMRENNYDYVTICLDNTVSEEEKQILIQNRRLLRTIIETHVGRFLAEEANAIKNYLNPLFDEAIANIPSSVSSLSREELNTRIQYLESIRRSILVHYDKNGIEFTAEKIRREIGKTNSDGIRVFTNFITNEEIEAQVVNYFINSFKPDSDQIAQLNAAQTFSEKNGISNKLIRQRTQNISDTNRSLASQELSIEFIRRNSLNMEPRQGGDIRGWLMSVYREHILPNRLSSLEEGSLERADIENYIAQLGTDVSFSTRCGILTEIDPDFMDLVEQTYNRYQSITRENTVFKSIQKIFNDVSYVDLDDKISQAVTSKYQSFINDNFREESRKLDALNAAIVRMKEEVRRR